MPGIVYDTGALVAAERRHRGVWALHEQSLAGGVRPIVPVVILAQAWRGTPHANLARLLRGCRVTPDTEDLGKAAGRICGRSGTSDVVDALVVATALRLQALVVTCDPDDLQHLASSVHSKLVIFSV
ncbi:MAG: PIN domain-containing protein [Pseudonocardiaceae bacterium]